VSLGDAVEREEHADVDGTASKKTSPSVAQRSKKKKNRQKSITCTLQARKWCTTPAEGKNPAERITQNIKFLFFLEKDETFFFKLLVCARVFFF
jgi:hypothetical protein